MHKIIHVIYSYFRMTSRPRTTSFVDSQKGSNANNFGGMKISSKDGSKVMTVIASPGQGPDRSTEVSYTDTKVEIMNLLRSQCDNKYLAGHR